MSPLEYIYLLLPGPVQLLLGLLPFQLAFTAAVLTVWGIIATCRVPVKRSPLLRLVRGALREGPFNG